MQSKHNKKGQAAEGMTWTVATFIILILAVLFILVSGIMGKANINIFGVNNEKSAVDEQQMLFSILEKKDDGNSVREMIDKNELIKAREKGQAIANRFNMLNCVFAVNERSNERNTAEGAEVVINGKEVSLTCN